MSDDISITISGTDAKMLAVWQRQNAEVLKNQKALLAMGQAGEQAGNKIGASMERSNAGLSKGIGYIQQFAAGIVGVGTVMRGIQTILEQVKREYEHLRGQQTRAGQRQVDVASIQREVFDNLGDDKTLTPQMANLNVARISEKTSMKPADVMQVLSTALSFKERSATAASVLPIVEMAAQMYPENAQAAAAAAKGMQGISKIAPNAKAKDIQGFLLGAQLASPVTNAENFAAYQAPGIAQLMSLGNTGKESAAFLGALGQGIGDEEGRITANAAITFQKQLLEETRGKVKGGVFQQLAYLQTPEGNRVKKKLLGPLMEGNKNAKKIGLEGEAKAFATLIGFIQGGGRYNEILQGTLADTPDIEGAGHFVDEREARLAGDPLQKNARIKRILASGAERAQLTQTAAGRQGITIGGLKEYLTSAGAKESEIDILLEAYKVRTEGAPEGILGKIGQGLGLITPPGRQSPDVAAAGLMRFEASRLETGRQYYLGSDNQFGVTSEMTEAARSLRAAADLIERGADRQAQPQQAKAGPAVEHDRRRNPGGGGGG